MRWYRVLRYDPKLELCDLAPASQQHSGLLYNVPIALWGGSWNQQVETPLRLTQQVDPATWGSAEDGPRWGLSLPVQQGDLAKVEIAGHDQSSPVITAFIRGIEGTTGAAVIGEEQGESIEDRLDVLLPSGAWARCKGDGSWVVGTGPVGEDVSSIQINRDGSINILSAKSINLETEEINLTADRINYTAPEQTFDSDTIELSGKANFADSGQTIGGTEIAIIGAIDSAGHPIVESGQ